MVIRHSFVIGYFVIRYSLDIGYFVIRHSFVIRLFGIDTRSLAVFRIGLGALLVVDLVIRANDLKAHYSDAGVAPRDLIWDHFQGTWRWSLHMLGGSAAFQAFLFSAAAVAALSLLLGYRTRLAICLSWLLVISLHVRNPLVLNAGDVLLRMLLFWSMFLPLGGKWSIDSRRRGTRPAESVLSVASGAILLQVCLVYWMSAYFKFQGAWTTENILAGIIQFDSYAKPLAHMLRPYPPLVDWLEVVILWSELIGPLLVFSPVLTKPLRLLVISWFVLLHLGIELSLAVGIFSYTSWLAWTLFLPDSFWRAVGRVWIRFGPLGRQAARCGPPPPPTSRRRAWLEGIVVGLFLLYVLLWNGSTMRGRWAKSLMPYPLAPLADLTMVGQYWNLFSNVPSPDGWYILVGRLKDGRAVDLMRDGKPADWESFTKPVYIWRQAPNHRWRKLYRRLLDDGQQPFRESLCRYFAICWNQTHRGPSSVAVLELHYMQELGTAAGESDRFQQRILCTLVVETKQET